MTDDKPSIAELQCIEQELPDEWRYDHQGYIESMSRTLNHTGGETEVLVLGARNEHSDGEGIVALRNAAPVLLEIAAAALAWRVQRAVNLHAALMRTEAEIEAEEQDVQRARVKRTADLARALEVAIAKVRP